MWWDPGRYTQVLSLRSCGDSPVRREGTGYHYWSTRYPLCHTYHYSPHNPWRHHSQSAHDDLTLVETQTNCGIYPDRNVLPRHNVHQEYDYLDSYTSLLEAGRSHLLLWSHRGRSQYPPQTRYHWIDYEKHLYGCLCRYSYCEVCEYSPT